MTFQKVRACKDALCDCSDYLDDAFADLSNWICKSKTGLTCVGLNARSRTNSSKLLLKLLFDTGQKARFGVAFELKVKAIACDRIAINEIFF